MYETEAQFQDAVVDLARLMGYRVAHFRPARTTKGWRTAGSYDSAGFPDLVLVRDRVIYAELKAAKNAVTPDQRAWLNALEHAGQEVFVWRPDDWDAIAATLARDGAGGAQ